MCSSAAYFALPSACLTAEKLRGAVCMISVGVFSVLSIKCHPDLLKAPDQGSFFVCVHSASCNFFSWAFKHFLANFTVYHNLTEFQSVTWSRVMYCRQRKHQLAAMCTHTAMTLIVLIL